LLCRALQLVTKAKFWLFTCKQTFTEEGSERKKNLQYPYPIGLKPLSRAITGILDDGQWL
jgi:hypothetical protein